MAAEEAPPPADLAGVAAADGVPPAVAVVAQPGVVANPLSANASVPVHTGANAESNDDAAAQPTAETDEGDKDVSCLQRLKDRGNAFICWIVVMLCIGVCILFQLYVWGRCADYVVSRDISTATGHRSDQYCKRPQNGNCPWLAADGLPTNDLMATDDSILAADGKMARWQDGHRCVHLDDHEGLEYFRGYTADNVETTADGRTQAERTAADADGRTAAERTAAEACPEVASVFSNRVGAQNACGTCRENCFRSSCECDSQFCDCNRIGPLGYWSPLESTYEKKYRWDAGFWVHANPILGCFFAVIASLCRFLCACAVHRTAQI
jgi:hypothetical protein